MAKNASASSGAPSSKSLLFMMIAMTCGVCVLLAGGLLMASRVINALGLRSSSDKTTVRTPIGDYRLEKAQQVGPGLPVYPAASLVLPGPEAARLAETDGNQPQVVSSTYHTNSGREFVASWYVEHLSAEFARQDSGPKKLPEEFRNSHISDSDITFVGERGDQIRIVDLTEDDTGTKITLLRTSKPPAPQTAPAQ
ncbi:MAG TPA: hypothetical protein VMH48_01245 [Methylomirabilota bacterium]|nr:hypothetical protein [Methylomirabilota bacterium]